MLHAGSTSLRSFSMADCYGAAEVATLIDRLAAGIASMLSDKASPVVVGIRTRGDVLADRLAPKLTADQPLDRGVLDITLYRDDLSEIGPRAVVRPTSLDVDIHGRPLVLVDDVLFTGRTVRAALGRARRLRPTQPGYPRRPRRPRRTRTTDPTRRRRRQTRRAAGPKSPRSIRRT